MNETTTPPEQTYRILKLEASNVQMLRAIEIVPNRSTVTLTGKNANGKSSILNAIAWILAGAKAIPSEPIRRGTSRAESVIDLGDFVCTLKISQGSGAKLTIKSKDGQDIRQPATLLKNYTNEILIDPVGFLRLGENPEGQRKQSEKLRQLVGLDFAPLDAEKEQAYEARKLKNAALAISEGKLANYKLEPGVPVEEVSVKDLMAKLATIEQEEKETVDRFNKNSDDAANLARAKNEENDKVKANLEAIGRDLTKAKERLVEVETDIKHVEEQLNLLRSNKTLLTAAVNKLECERDGHKKAVLKLSYEDMGALQATRQESLNKLRAEFSERSQPIREQISKADETNTKVRGNKRYKELKAEIVGIRDESDKLTQQIEAVDRKKEELLAAAKFPLEGLSFNETGITFNGFPLEQASQAQQLKVILAIGFALKPRIRVALIREASLLDDDSLAEVAAIAEREDAQVWLECVRSDDATALVIEDGMVKE